MQVCGATDDGRSVKRAKPSHSHSRKSETVDVISLKSRIGSPLTPTKKAKNNVIEKKSKNLKRIQ